MKDLWKWDLGSIEDLFHEIMAPAFVKIVPLASDERKPIKRFNLF